MSSKLDTIEYIRTHIQNVQLWMARFCKVLNDRAEAHDRSKLEPPELTQWKLMDQEPRYDYGTPEYKDKMARYAYLFEMHWRDRRNRHHPEHFQGFYHDMTLFDLIEMLCDWFSYKKDISFGEAEDLITNQCKRYGFSEETRSLLFETVKVFFLDKAYKDPEEVEEIPYDEQPHIDLFI